MKGNKSKSYRDLSVKARTSLRTRFLGKLPQAASDECWEWPAGRTAKGYGVIHAAGKAFYAHRIAYEILRGPVGDAWVLHRCDNPPCVNPDHLFLGTVADNVHDMINKGRGAPGGNEPVLNPEKARAMRAAYRCGVRVHAIARAFDVDYTVCHAAISRKSWGSVDPDGADDPREALGKHRPANGYGEAKLNPEKVRAIRVARQEGRAISAIAREHGIASKTCRDVLQGKTWKHVDCDEAAA